MPQRQQVALDIRLKANGFAWVNTFQRPVVVGACYAVEIGVGKTRAVKNQAQVVAVLHGKITPGRLSRCLNDGLWGHGRLKLGNKRFFDSGDTTVPGSGWLAAVPGT